MRYKGEIGDTVYYFSASERKASLKEYIIEDIIEEKEGHYIRRNYKLNSNGKLANISIDGGLCGLNDIICKSKKTADKLFLEHVQLSIKKYEDLFKKFPERFSLKWNDAMNYYLKTLDEITKIN